MAEKIQNLERDAKRGQELMSQAKERILAFLDRFTCCVMSTVTADSAPEAAYVGFQCSRDMEFLVGTSKLSRKYKNLQQNPGIAIVVASDAGEVQYEGTAKEIGADEYDKLVASGAFAALPGIEKYRNDPNQVYLKIKPTWLRFILHGESDTIEEMTEF